MFPGLGRVGNVVAGPKGDPGPQGPAGSLVAPWPADHFVNRHYRLFGYGGGRIDALSTSINLLANPAERAGWWADVTMHVLCQSPESPTDPVFFTPMVTAMANFQQLSPPMPCYPGARIFSGALRPFSDWVSRSYWVTMAEAFRNVADVRLAGDPRVGIDAENYSVESDEPTADSLIGHGYTVEQFQEAIEPFIDMLEEEGIYPIGMYPNITGGAATLHQFGKGVMDRLGPTICELWWENTFGATERYRVNLGVGGYYGMMLNQRAAESAYERAVGYAVNHRAVDDDDALKVSGTLHNVGGTSPATMGSTPPWFFDESRLLPTAGTPAWRQWTDYSALNGADYVHYLRPMGGTSLGGAAITSVGIAATPLGVEIWAGQAGTQVVTPSALVNTSVSGIQLNTPAGPNTWLGLRLAAFPLTNTTPWTFKFPDFTIPTSVASDLPLAFLGQSNAAIAALYYLQASDKVVLLVAASGIQSYDVLASPTRGTPFRVVIGRSGLTWRHAANGGTGTSHTTATQAGTFASMLIGAGPDTSMTNNSLRMMPNLVLTGQSMLYLTSGLLSEADCSTMSSLSTNYPIGRGT